MSMNPSSRTGNGEPFSWRRLFAAVAAQFWLKSIGTTAFMTLFFVAYIYLLKHPAYPVITIPVTALDKLIGIEPLALPLYLSLWVYVSLPPTLMVSRRELVEYGAWVGSLCLTALTIFYFWPTAVPPAHIDWALYPGMAFLKGIDAAGNACPSLHVASAVFSWFWLNRHLPGLGLGRARSINTIWCSAIVYSTMATRQHMAIDVYAGIALAVVFAWAYGKAGQRRRTPAFGANYVPQQDQLRS